MESKPNNTNSTQKKEPRSKKKLLITVLLIGVAIASPFLIYWILQISLNTTSPMVVVVSGSMEPNLSKGDLLFLYGKDPADIKNGTVEEMNGDIIVFDASGLWPNPPDEPVVHRVVDKWYSGTDQKWYFKTKGDNNNYVDPPGTPSEIAVPENKIIGVVSGVIPLIGWIRIFFTESGLLFPLIGLILGILIISIILDFVKESKQKTESKKELPIDEEKEHSS